MVDAAAPLPGLSVLGGAASTEEERAVRALPEGGESRPSGALHSVAHSVGLCLLRCEGAFNHAASFREQAPLPEGTRLETSTGQALALRAPPYAFTVE